MQDGLSIIICSHKSDILKLDNVLSNVKIACKDLIHEIILVSNGGQLISNSEFSTRYVSYFGCKVIEVEQGNLGVARATGLNNCIYEIIMFIDDDNLVSSDYIRYAYNKIKNDQMVSVVGCFVGATKSVEMHLNNLFKYKTDTYAKIFAIDLAEKNLDFGFTEVSSVYGAGLSSRRNVLLNIFSKQLICSGRSGNQLLSGDDTEICFKALKFGKILRWNNYGIFHDINLSRIDTDYVKRLSSKMLITLPFLHFLYWKNKHSSLISFFLCGLSSLLVSLKFTYIYRCSIKNYFYGLIFLLKNK
jgi:glycosyltransferase involved in cell wall biosynthesis